MSFSVLLARKYVGRREHSGVHMQDVCTSHLCLSSHFATRCRSCHTHGIGYDTTSYTYIQADRRRTAKARRADNADATWKRQAEKMRHDLGPAALAYRHPWSRNCAEPAPSRFLSQRMVELLDLCFLARCIEAGASMEQVCRNIHLRHRLAKGLWVDLSQAIERKPWRLNDMPTYTTSSVLYSYEFQCIAEPEEVLAVYGRPIRHNHGLSGEEMRNLVGNCAAAQPMAAMLHAVLAAFGLGLPGVFQPPLGSPSSSAGAAPSSVAGAAPSSVAGAAPSSIAGAAPGSVAGAA